MAEQSGNIQIARKTYDHMENCKGCGQKYTKKGYLVLKAGSTPKPIFICESCFQSKYAGIALVERIILPNKQKLIAANQRKKIDTRPHNPHRGQHHRSVYGPVPRIPGPHTSIPSPNATATALRRVAGARRRRRRRRGLSSIFSFIADIDWWDVFTTILGIFWMLVIFGPALGLFKWPEIDPSPIFEFLEKILTWTN